MPIVASAAPSYPKAPPGAYAATCIDVVDLGMVENRKFKKTQPMIRIIWQIDKNDEQGKPFHVTKRYTKSLSEKANLRLDLVSWRGRPFSEEQLKGFDVEAVIGAGCYLNVIHNERDGKTYADVKSIMPLPSEIKKPIPARDYVRVCNRKPNQSEPEPPEDLDEDTVPF